MYKKKRKHFSFELLNTSPGPPSGCPFSPGKRLVAIRKGSATPWDAYGGLKIGDAKTTLKIWKGSQKKSE